MNGLDIQAAQPGAENAPSTKLPRFDRTVFDYIIIAAGYLFTPLGLLLAIIRLISSQHKNYRRASNPNLFMHVFTGGFIEVSIFTYRSSIQDGDAFSLILFVLVMFALLFLLPARILSGAAAKERYKFSQLVNRYMKLIMDQSLRSIGALSVQAGESENDVRRDILYLKKVGILSADLLFYEGGHEEAAANNLQEQLRASGLGIPGIPRTSGQQEPRVQQSQAPPLLPKSIQCPSCGAQNTVQPDRSKACDYCGTEIPYH